MTRSMNAGWKILAIVLFVPWILCAQEAPSEDAGILSPEELPVTPPETPVEPPANAPAVGAPKKEAPAMDQKISDLPEKQNTPQTNTGDPFRDPFDDTPAEEAKPERLPAERPGAAELPADQTNEQPPAVQEPARPRPAAQPRREEVREEAVPPPPLQTPVPGFEKPKEFQFPPVEDVKGPESVDYRDSQRAMAALRQGLINLGFGMGAALNMNRRINQFSLEVSGGYRWKEELEFGGIVYGRFVKDTIIGFLGLVKWDYNLKKARNMSIDILPFAGLGWAMRKPASGSKFSEGRMPVRFGSEFLFYPFPQFAIDLQTAIEAFLFSIDTDGNGTNFFSKGLPTQLILTGGVRFEF